MDLRTNQTQVAFELGDSAASKKAHEVLPEWEEDGHVCGQQQFSENERLEAAMAGVSLTLVLGTTLHECILRYGGEISQDFEISIRSRILAIVGIGSGILFGVQKLGFERWYRRLYFRELAREKWELENYERGEQEEMTGLFAHKGMSKTDAESVVRTMSTYKDFFVNIMMTEELGLREPLPQLEMRALAVAAAFSSAAILPLIATRCFLFFFYSYCYHQTFFCPSSSIQNSQHMLTIAFGILLLGLLGARRATMSKLAIFTHSSEAVALAFICIIIPKIIFTFL